MNSFFTETELKSIGDLPMRQFKELLEDMLSKAKLVLFDVIASKTQQEVPDDYMLTHKHEFQNICKSTEGHSFVSVWSWKGHPIVQQQGVIEFDGVNIVANIQTQRCHS